MTPETPSDLFFTPSVKAVQSRRCSRDNYARMAAAGAFRTEVTFDLAAFLAERDSVYFATANAGGQPYIQHRGGPSGFLRVLDARALGSADYRGMTRENWCSKLDRMFAGKVRSALWARHGNERSERTLGC